MYAKLSLRNVRRSARDYAIYAITLILSSALFYGFTSLSSNHYPAVLPVQYNMEYVQELLKYPVMAIACLLVFLIRYVNRHMLTVRQKEFALEILMGMERKTVATVFFSETLILGSVAVLVGIPLGMLFSQFVTAVVMNVYSVPFHMYFSLFPDTVLTTLLFFSVLFLLVGASNIAAIRKMKIIDLLHSDRMVHADFSTSKNMLLWVIISCIAALAMACLGIYALVAGYHQGFSSRGHFWGASTVTWLHICAVAPCIFLLMGVGFFIKLHRKKNAFILLLLLLALSLLCSIGLINLHLSLGVSLWLPIMACLFLIFFTVGLFDCLSGIILLIRQKSLSMRYRNLFLFGQITEKLKVNSRIMAVIALAMTAALVIISVMPSMATTTAAYRQQRTMYDLVVNMIWDVAESMDDIPPADHSFAYISTYLEENGYTVADSVSVQYYFQDDTGFEGKEDYRKRQPFCISLCDYNHLRIMAGYDPVSLGEDAFILQWDSTGIGESDIHEYERSHLNQSINGRLLERQASVEDFLGEFVSSDMYSFPIYVLPDAVCEGMTTAAIRFYCNTTEPLAFDFATKANRDLNRLTLASHPIYAQMQELQYPSVFIKTLIAAEGVNMSIILSLCLLYLAVCLLIICFTMLSVQMLADSTKNTRRYATLMSLGVSANERAKLLRQQIAYWFGLPSVVSLLAASLLIAFYIASEAKQIAIYIGWSSFFGQLFVVFFIIAVLLICYYTATYLLGKRNI